MKYEIDFLPVGEGHGDAICVRHGHANTGYTVDVIDGGFTETGESVVTFLANQHQTDAIANLVLTHADNDHAIGLKPILEKCRVTTLRMNLPWEYAADILPHFPRHTLAGLIKKLKEDHPYLVELQDIALQRGTHVTSIFAGDTYSTTTVLAPLRSSYISLLPRLDESSAPSPPKSLFEAVTGAVKHGIDAGLEYWGVETLEENPQPTSPSNETSVVQLARFDDHSALFTGDVGRATLWKPPPSPSITRCCTGQHCSKFHTKAAAGT